MKQIKQAYWTSAPLIAVVAINSFSEASKLIPFHRHLRKVYCSRHISCQGSTLTRTDTIQSRSADKAGRPKRHGGNKAVGQGALMCLISLPEFLWRHS